MFISLIWCLLLFSSVMAAPSSQVMKGKTRHKLLLISFDGFRWNYDQDVDTPHLNAFCKDGVKAKYLTPAFMTITSPCHFTILTGKHIQNHGVIHNMWFNPETGAKLPYYPTQGVSEWWDNGSLPIWITAQKQGLKTGSIYFPGGNATYRGETVNVKKVEPAIFKYDNETEWRQNIDTVMKWFTENDLDFVALYFGEPDSTGHKYGPESEERKAMVEQVDRTVGYLMDRTETYELKSKLNVIITSDHGMRTILKRPEVNEIVLGQIQSFSFQDVKFNILDYGPNGFLLPKEGKLETVYQALKNAHPKLRVYKKEDFPGRFRYASNPRIPPIILNGDPGYVIHGRIPVQPNKGEHGFDNEDMDMKTIFRASGPSFKKNLVVEPFESIHIYELMCELLGITPEPNDGSLYTTMHMLNTVAEDPLPTDTPTDSDTWSFSLSVGLGAVVGFLALVFIVTTIYTSCKRKKDAMSETTKEWHDNAGFQEMKITNL